MERGFRKAAKHVADQSLSRAVVPVLKRRAAGGREDGSGARAERRLAASGIAIVATWLGVGLVYELLVLVRIPQPVPVLVTGLVRHSGRWRAARDPTANAHINRYLVWLATCRHGRSW